MIGHVPNSPTNREMKHIMEEETANESRSSLFEVDKNIFAAATN